MNKSLSIIILLFCGIHVAVGQEINLIGRVNQGIGLHYLPQDFKGILTKYRPGGGLSFEAGLEGELPQDIYWYGTVGMIFNLNLHFQDVNGKQDRSFYTWNKKCITVGANKYFDLPNKYIPQAFAGGALNYYQPGKLKREENNKYKGAIEYKSTLGFQIESGVVLDVLSAFKIRPSLRYSYAKFQSEKYSQGTIDKLPEALQTAKASSIDFSVSILKQIGGQKRRR
jgi:hypothetical protein